MTVVEHLLEKFFGTQQKLANLVGVGQSTVAGWHNRDSIPHNQQRQIISRAAAQGMTIEPSDFFPAIPKVSNEAPK